MLGLHARLPLNARLTESERPQAEAFICNALVIILGILNAQSLGLAVGAIMPGYQQAQTTATVLILTFMLCSGFWIQEVPSFLRWIRCVLQRAWRICLPRSHHMPDQPHDTCPRSWRGPISSASAH